jgi:hypothetical protein
VDSAAKSPVGDLVVNGLGAHIVNVLHIGASPYFGEDAVKLAGLKHNVAQISLANPKILPVADMNPIHHHSGDCPHTILAFTPRDRRKHSECGFTMQKTKMGNRHCADSPYINNCKKSKSFLKSHQKHRKIEAAMLQ